MALRGTFRVLQDILTEIKSWTVRRLTFSPGEGKGSWGDEFESVLQSRIEIDTPSFRWLVALVLEYKLSIGEEALLSRRDFWEAVLSRLDYISNQIDIQGRSRAEKANVTRRIESLSSIRDGGLQPLGPINALDRIDPDLLSYINALVEVEDDPYFSPLVDLNRALEEGITRVIEDPTSDNILNFLLLYAEDEGLMLPQTGLTHRVGLNFPSDLMERDFLLLLRKKDFQRKGIESPPKTPEPRTYRRFISRNPTEEVCRSVDAVLADLMAERPAEFIVEWYDAVQAYQSNQEDPIIISWITALVLEATVGDDPPFLDLARDRLRFISATYGSEEQLGTFGERIEGIGNPQWETEDIWAFVSLYLGHALTDKLRDTVDGFVRQHRSPDPTQSIDPTQMIVQLYARHIDTLLTSLRERWSLNRRTSLLRDLILVHKELHAPDAPANFADVLQNRLQFDRDLLAVPRLDRVYRLQEEVDDVPNDERDGVEKLCSDIMDIDIDIDIGQLEDVCAQVTDMWSIPS